MLPESGSVLGVDVGWSLKQRSSAVCRLDWDGESVQWTIRRFTGQTELREAAMAEVIGSHPLLAAALDGPLRGDLAVVDRYRGCEKALSVKPIAGRISQPGSSRSPVGRLLNHHTNEFARLVIDSGRLRAASHAHAIHPLALAEAFPTSFLGLLHPDPEKGLRVRRSDRYYEAAVADGVLDRLLGHHLPGRKLEQSFETVTNHDDSAALVCAITALGVARNDYTTVGDDDGWIILPPADFIADWARPLVADWN
ncbi:hypothetical protein SAMN05428969_1784 [Devosia sp. YR412]|nr:hypothetical protein SAMN05428969_1784 [Devosia sp. YR412]